jgi:hypothetical protein
VSGEIAVDADVAAFLGAGVAAVAVSRDDHLRPEIARAWGPLLSPDGCTLRICVSAASDSAMIANLERNGAFAVTFTLPTTYRSIQLKGTSRDVAEPTSDELALAERHIAAFVDQAEQVGVPRAIGSRFAEPPFTAVTIAIRELYDQTPGAGAGRPL